MLLCGEPVVDDEAQTRGSSPLWVSGRIQERGWKLLPVNQYLVERCRGTPYMMRFRERSATPTRWTPEAPWTACRS